MEVEIQEGGKIESDNFFGTKTGMKRRAFESRIATCENDCFGRENR